ncbi:MAG: ATP-dependent helicase RecG, partial [Agromyces sp.]|nr:ATP-dependent helicase RecG [Agromyces sp.]
MTAEGADAAGAGRYTLDTRLSVPLGGRTAQGVERAFGYRTVGEFLSHYPRRYAMRGELTALASLPLDEHVTIVAEVLEVRVRDMRQRRGSIVEAKISDGTGILTLTFFNQRWRENELRPGRRGVFSGKVGDYKGNRQLAHPAYQLFDDEVALSTDDPAVKRWAEAPIPIYAATSTLSSWDLQKSMKIVLDGLGPIDDPVPAEVR